MANLNLRARLRRGLVAATLVAGAVLSLAGQAPTFRAGVDLIAVDVQVVNDKGLPILGLGPDKFEVSINGKKRNVVSADLLRFDDATLTKAIGSPLPQIAGIPTGFKDNDPADGRVFVIAVDTMSFQALETAPVREAAHAFVDQLQANDLVGFISFPLGRTLDATRDRLALTMELDRLVGYADRPTNTYKLMPHEIADLTSLPPGVDDPTGPKTPFPIQGRLVDEICKGQDALCKRRVVQEARTLASLEEGMVLRRLGALRDVLRELRKSPRRK
jgi:hypothetical protein